jgi:hypothetical protein
MTEREFQIAFER